MSDTTLNAFVASVADAASRAAFTPSPPTPAAGPGAGYFLLQRDTNVVYTWNSGSATWVAVGSGGGTIPTVSQGDLLYGSAAATLSALAKSASATRYLSNTGASNNPAWAQVDLTNGVTGDLPFANLAQGSALSVLGVTGNATADNASIAAGSDHQVMRRSGTAVGFGAVNLAQAAAVTGVLPAANVATELTLLTADPASPVDDTWWVVRTGTSPTMTVALKTRIAGASYTIASITL